MNKIDLMPDGIKEVDLPGGKGERIYYISALANRGLDEIMKVLYAAVREESASDE